MHGNLHGRWCRDTTKRGFVLIAAIMFCLTGLAIDASEAGQTGSYIALKGGIYSPSAEFDLGNINVETTFDGDAKSGFAGEIAVGHFFLRSFALELGIGYFKAEGSFADELAAQHELDFNVIPVVLSAKVFLPIGPINPYGEAGVGAYFSELNVSDNANTFDGTTTFGIHAGAGLNVNVSSSMFMGVESRYVWDDPSFGDQQINLNGDDYSLNGFKLNGFTTMVVLGFGF